MRIRFFLPLISSIALRPRHRTKPVSTHDLYATKKKDERGRLLTASLAPGNSAKHQTRSKTNHFSESTMSHIIQFSIVHTIRITFEVPWGTEVSVTWHFNGRLYTDEVGWESGPYVEGVRMWTHRTGETSSLSLFYLVIEVPLCLSHTRFPFHKPDLTTSATPIAPGESTRDLMIFFGIKSYSGCSRSYNHLFSFSHTNAGWMSN